MKYFRQAINIITSDATFILVFALNACSSFTTKYTPFDYRWDAILLLLMVVTCVVERRKKHVVNFATKDAIGSEPAKSTVTPENGTKIKGAVNEKGELIKLTVYADTSTFFGFEQK